MEAANRLDKAPLLKLEGNSEQGTSRPAGNSTFIHEYSKGKFIEGETAHLYKIMITHRVGYSKALSTDHYLIGYEPEVSEEVCNKFNLDYIKVQEKRILESKTNNIRVPQATSAVISAAVTAYARIYMNKIQNYNLFISNNRHSFARRHNLAITKIRKSQTALMRFTYSNSNLVNPLPLHTYKNTGKLILTASFHYTSKVDTKPSSANGKFNNNFITNTLSQLKIFGNDIGFLNTRDTQYNIENFVYEEYSGIISGKNNIINNIDHKFLNTDVYNYFNEKNYILDKYLERITDIGKLNKLEGELFNIIFNTVDKEFIKGLIKFQFLYVLTYRNTEYEDKVNLLSITISLGKKLYFFRFRAITVNCVKRDN